MATHNVCANSCCSTLILSSAVFCRKHTPKVSSPQKKGKKEKRMFKADGSVNIGMGLSRLSKQDNERRLAAKEE